MSTLGDVRPDVSIALYSGIYIHRDAVSYSLRCKLAVLDRLNDRGARIGVTLFTHATDDASEHVKVVPSISELLRHEAFWSADIHAFEFAIRYELFDAIMMIEPGTPVLVTDHNVTPPDLVDMEEAKLACELAQVQRYNMALATRIACDSEFNRDVDVALGLASDKLSVLHLPPAHRCLPKTRHDANGQRARPVKLYYIGRLVRSKGILDLLQAVLELCNSGEEAFSLTLAGNISFSDPLVLEKIEDVVRSVGSDRLRILESPSEEELIELMASSDSLVIPSYHEGYCVPVVEALTAHCYVIAYDAGNLPNVVGGLGTLVPTGDVAALREAIREFVRGLSGASNEPGVWAGMDHRTWARAVDLHLRGYSEEAYEQRFLSLLRDLASVSQRAASSHSTRVVEERLAEFSNTTCAASASSSTP